jgi:hypothetical protein
VAPEQTSRASRITIDGFGSEGFKAWRRERWYAVLTPVIPAPIIAMSHSGGRVSEVQYESIGWSSERQYEEVGLGTGKLLLFWTSPDRSSLAWLGLLKKEYRVFMLSVFLDERQKAEDG